MNGETMENELNKGTSSTADPTEQAALPPGTTPMVDMCCRHPKLEAFSHKCPAHPNSARPDVRSSDIILGSWGGAHVGLLRRCFNRLWVVLLRSLPLVCLSPAL